MTDYVQAKEALTRLHRRAVTAEQERDELMSVIRRIGSETTEPDALLAVQTISRITLQAMEAWDAHREAEVQP